MPITKIRVGKGKSVPVNPQDPASEWVKSYYELEAVPGPNEVPDQVRDYLEEMISRWLGEMPLEEVKKIPELDIESLPWSSYARKGAAAKPGEAGWCWSSLENAQQLVKLIKESPDGKLELPPYLFQLSGDQEQFISRRPVKG